MKWPKTKKNVRGRPAICCCYRFIAIFRWGLEVRPLEVVYEAELPEPFVAAHFRNRNIALLPKEGGLIIHVQKFKTYHSAR